MEPMDTCVEFLPCGIPSLRNSGPGCEGFFPGDPNLFRGETKFPFLSFRDILILHLLFVRKDEDPPANEWIGNSVIHSRDPSKSLGSTDPSESEFGFFGKQIKESFDFLPKCGIGLSEPLDDLGI